jgi:DNA (cytosine-5)-methyltransferase 1
MSFTFVDLFAGCGGLSLGLIQSGGTGLLAVEKSPNAFETLYSNLGSSAGPLSGFDWTSLIPAHAMPTSELLSKYESQLKKLSVDVDVVAGGPPCQGFSVYGRRNKDDARNRLYLEYLKVVEELRPTIVLLENVTGIDMPFLMAGEQAGKQSRDTVACRIVSKLNSLNYKTTAFSLCASDFGVPQRRKRFFVIAVKTRRDITALFSTTYIESLRINYLKSLSLSSTKKVSVSDAISDLEIAGENLKTCVDMPNRSEIVYRGPVSQYQKAMHQGLTKLAPPDSLRLARHSLGVIEKFKLIQQLATPGRNIDSSLKEQLNTVKQRIHLLNSSMPSPTVTTLPDDLVHYSEPRILTVRELARLQSFPDWFGFTGPYTTGGDRRSKQCPRFTQVGNAVPVRLGEFMGIYVADLLRNIRVSEELPLAA